MVAKITVRNGSKRALRPSSVMVSIYREPRPHCYEAYGGAAAENGGRPLDKASSKTSIAIYSWRLLLQLSKYLTSCRFLGEASMSV